MEAQSKVLADLLTAISAMNAKLDDMRPIFLELNKCCPGLERAVNALPAEVGELRPHVVATSPLEPAVGTDMPPLLLLSSDAPSSSSKLASASKQTSAAAATSYSDNYLGTNHAIPGDAAPLAIVEVVPEVDLSASTGFIATAHTTCSTVCLPRQPVATPVLVVSSPVTPVEYGLSTNSIPVAAVPLDITGVLPAVLALEDFAPTVQLQQLCNGSELFRPSSSQRIISIVPAHRPMPWPSLMVVHADGDEARPQPWPTFKGINDCESSNVAIMKPSQRCTSDSSHTTMGDVVDVQIPDCYGETISGVFGTMDWHLLDFPCRSAVTVCLSYPQELDHYFYSSQLQRLLILNLMRRLDVSYDLFSRANQHTSCFPGYFFIGVHMHVVRTKKQDSELIYVSGLYRAKLCGMFREFQNWLIYMLQHWNSCRPESVMTWDIIVFASFQHGKKDQHQVRLIFGLKQVAISSLGVLLSLIQNLHTVLQAMDNATSAWAVYHVSAPEPIAVNFHLFAIRLELALNHAAIGRRVLLILYHYCALGYLVLWSVTVVILTETVNMLNHHRAVMTELACAVAADHFQDVPPPFSLCRGISAGAMQILFSGHMSEELVSAAAVAIWWFPAAPCKCLVAFPLHLARLGDSCRHVGVRWNDLMISSSRLRPHKCMPANHTTKRRTKSVGGPKYVLYLGTSFLLDVHLTVVKSKQRVAASIIVRLTVSLIWESVQRILIPSTVRWLLVTMLSSTWTCCNIQMTYAGAVATAQIFSCRRVTSQSWPLCPGDMEG